MMRRFSNFNFHGLIYLFSYSHFDYFCIRKKGRKR